MNLEEAKRLQDNPDYIAFTRVIEQDINGLMENMVNADNIDLVNQRVQIRTLRLVLNRLPALIGQLED